MNNTKFQIGDTVIRTDNDYGTRYKVAAIAKDTPLSIYRYILNVFDPYEIVRDDWVKEEILITESEYEERNKIKTIRDVLKIEVAQEMFGENEFVADAKCLTGCPPVGRGKTEHEALYDLLAKLMLQIGTKNGEGFVNQWTGEIKQFWENLFNQPNPVNKGRRYPPI